MSPLSPLASHLPLGKSDETPLLHLPCKHNDVNSQPGKASAFFSFLKIYSFQSYYWNTTIVSWLAGIFSPVTTKDYIRAKKHCSICLPFFTQHASHQTTNYPKTTKSVLTQMYRKHKQPSNNFFFISPFSIAPVKKVRKARTRWYRGPLWRFVNTRF